MAHITIHFQTHPLVFYIFLLNQEETKERLIRANRKYVSLPKCSFRLPATPFRKYE